MTKFNLYILRRLQISMTKRFGLLHMQKRKLERDEEQRAKKRKLESKAAEIPKEKTVSAENSADVESDETG